MRRVFVHIDRLVLKGFHHAERHDLAEGLRVELARILSEPATQAGFRVAGNVDTVNAGRLLVKHGASPTAVGAKAAQSIGKAML